MDCRPMGPEYGRLPSLKGSEVWAPVLMPVDSGLRRPN